MVCCNNAWYVRTAYQFFDYVGAPCPSCDISYHCDWSRTCAPGETCLARGFTGNLYHFRTHCAPVSTFLNWVNCHFVWCCSDYSYFCIWFELFYEVCCPDIVCLLQKEDCLLMQSIVKTEEVYCCGDRECLRNHLGLWS